MEKCNCVSLYKEQSIPSNIVVKHVRFETHDSSIKNQVLLVFVIDVR